MYSNHDRGKRLSSSSTSSSSSSSSSSSTSTPTVVDRNTFTVPVREEVKTGVEAKFVGISMTSFSSKYRSRTANESCKEALMWVKDGALIKKAHLRMSGAALAAVEGLISGAFYTVSVLIVISLYCSYHSYIYAYIYILIMLFM